MPAPGTAQPPVQAVAAQKKKRTRNVVSIGAPAAATGSATAPVQSPTTTRNPATIDQGPSGGISGEAFDLYQKRTEKEMKRLLAHAKKMKDFAYQADLKNHELRKTIAQLQLENQMLRNGLPAVTDGVLDGQNGVFQFPLEERLEQILADREAAREKTLAKHSVPIRVPLFAPPLPEGIDPNSQLARNYKSAEDFLSGDPSRGGVPPYASAAQLIEAWKRREKTDYAELLREGQAIAEADEDSEFKKRITHPKVYAINKARAAAARERLAKKSEARKASLEK